MKGYNYLIISVLLLAYILIGCSNNERINDTVTGDAYEGQMDEKDKNDNINETFEDPYPYREIDIGKDKLISIDESKEDETLQFFINNIKQAVSEKDVERFLTFLDEDVKYTFGDNKGKEGFINHFNLEDNSDISILWVELERILPWGGSYSKEVNNLYSIPYVFNYMNLETNEAYILGDYVNVREEPDISSESLEKLSFDIVDILSVTNKTHIIDNISYPWIEIESPSGNVGYVAGKYVYGAYDFRLGITKDEKGKWKIIYFIKGD